MIVVFKIYNRLGNIDKNIKIVLLKCKHFEVVF